MATLGDNIETMVDMVANLKTKYKNRLSEATILRVVEINVSMAMSGPQPTQPSFPTDDEGFPMNENGEMTDTEGNVIAFPPAPEEATTDPTTEDE